MFWWFFCPELEHFYQNMLQLISRNIVFFITKNFFSDKITFEKKNRFSYLNNHLISLHFKQTKPIHFTFSVVRFDVTKKLTEYVYERTT